MEKRNKTSFARYVILMLPVLLGIFVYLQKTQWSSSPAASALTGPINVSGTDYYVVTSLDPTEDTGDEVCAKVGKTCVGYTDYTTSACTAVHPTATIQSSGSGDKSGVYCDGSPQSGLCSSLTNTCSVCTSCGSGVSCSDPIGGLYREMYVECGAALGSATVTLNNGNNNLVAGSDLTSQTTNLTGIGAYQWTRNGSNVIRYNVPFNSGSSQTDFSGNGYTTTLFGDAAYTSSGCKVGGCLLLDGNDDYAVINQASLLSVSALTISAWVKNATSPYGVILSDRVDGSVWESVALNTTGVFDLNTSNSGATITSVTFPAINDGAWHHVAAVWTGTQMMVYVDGALAGGPTAFSGPLWATSQLPYVGAWHSSATPPASSEITGAIDELQIYSVGLSAAQVLQLYNDGNAGVGGPTTINSAETSAGQLWDLSLTPVFSDGSLGSAVDSSNSVFIISGASNITGSLNNPDEGSPIIASLTIPGGSTAGYRWRKNGSEFMALNMPMNSGSPVDMSGNSNNGTVSGATFSTSGCAVGGCYSFNAGTNKISIPNSSSLNISGPMSFSFWAKSSNWAAVSFNRIIQKGNGSGIAGYGCASGGASKIDCWYRSTSGTEYVRGMGLPSTNTWHYFVVEFNGSTVSIYLDGADVSTTAASSGYAGDSTELSIGNRAGNTTQGFTGSIDEVRIYPEILSTEQIAQEYQDGVAGIGGPTRISEQDHAAGDTWELISREFISDGSTGPDVYIGSATVASAAATTLGITTPSGLQVANVTVNYTCSNASSAARDFTVEYSTNGGSTFSSATLSSTSSGSLVGSNFISMANCANGGSSNSFVWNSLANGVTTSSNVQIRITAQYTSGPSATTSNFSIDNGTNLCTAGGEASGGLTAAETSFDNTTVQVNGCTYTIDGTHTFTNVLVYNSGVLTQTATTSSTVNKTTLTVSNLVSVASGSSISMDGKGFPYKYTTDGAGGVTLQTGITPNAGGSHGGLGGLQSTTSVATPVYDSITQPMEPGAGAYTADSGTAGGGYLKLTAAQMSISGTISADGAASAASTGAGGGLWISVSGAVTVSGTIRANGGASSNSFHGAGAGGRIAFYYNSGVSGNPSVSSLFSHFQSQSGAPSAATGTNVGAAGTIYFEDSSVHSAGLGHILVKNNSSYTPNGALTYTSITGAQGTLTIMDRATVRSSTLTLSGDLTIKNLGTLVHAASTTSVFNKLDVTVGGTTTIENGGLVDLTGLGFPLGYTSDGAGGVTAQTGVSGNCGGSYGGIGGCANSSAVPTGVFGSFTQPTEPGSGAYVSSTGTAGGGYLKLTTANLDVQSGGIIRANGTASTSSTGSGGGFWITTTGTVSIAGTIQANGGSSCNSSHGCGAGGRIALYYANGSLTPDSVITGNNVQAYGGVPSAANTTNRGAAGTMYFEDTAVQTAGDGDLYIGNNSSATTTYTPVSGSVGSLTIEENAIARADTLAISRNLVLRNAGTLTQNATTTSVVNRLTITVGAETNIDATSSIYAVGLGFLAGYTSNGAGGVTTTGASTANSGGSHGGLGGIASGSPGTPASVYDTFLQPTEPGGGAGNGTVGTGGGVVKLTTTNLVLAGTIDASGINTASIGAVSSGAGGSVWIDASGSVDVTGTVKANGGAGPANNFHAYGGGGRLAFYYDSAISGNPSVATLRAQLSANSGSGSASTSYGSGGTIYVEDSALHAANSGVVYISNTNLTSSTVQTPLSGTIPQLTIENGAKVSATTLTVTRDLTMTGTSVLTHLPTTTSTVYRLQVTVGGNTSIDATSSVDVSSKGFLGGYTTNGSGGTTTIASGSANSGGSHGGLGGIASGSPGTPTPVYDNIRQPIEPGSGAGNGGVGTGGGYVKLVTGGFSLLGTITADAFNTGGSGGVSSGAGGGIWISTTGAVTVSGSIHANGAAGPANNFHAYGAGGRIAFYYDSSVSGNPSFSALKSTLSARSGSGSASTSYGGAGTIYIEDAALHASGQGDLVVDNNNANGNTSRTPLFVVGQPETTYTLADLYVNHLGNLVIDTPCLGTPALTINGITDLSNGGTITNNQSGTCTVSQASISITTTSLPAALVGSAYSQSIVSAGGYGPHTFVCLSGPGGSVVACTTVLPAGLDMSTSGVISGTPSVAGSSTFTVRATEASPGVGSAQKTLTLVVDTAPTAPTNLFSNASDAQSCCSSATTDATPVFSAIFNDPDTGNTANKYEIQVASDNGFSTILWDSGASGTSMSATAIGARSPNIPYGGSALTLGGTTYYWRIKFWDNNDVASPFSSTATFVTSTSPTAPTNLFSNDSAAQTGLTNPLGVNAARPLFSAIFHDPDIGDTATKYRIQVSTANDFSALVWDSGAAGTSMTTCTEGLRCADITYGATTALDLDGTKYYWRIKFFDAAGLESAWSEDPISTNSFTMSAGGASVQRVQEQVQQNSKPAAPKASSVEVIDSTTLRYNWLDLSNNETGFRLLDDKGKTIVEVGAGVTSAQETNLTPNTVVSGRTIVAFNSVGVSDLSPFSSAVTAAPAIRPVLVRRGSNSVTFTVSPSISNLSQGSSGLLFEVVVQPSDATQKPRVLTSDWIKASEYTFTGINASDAVQVRVTTRNQNGLTSAPSTYAPIESLAHDFHVSLNVVKKGTNELPRPLSPLDIVRVSATVKNTGSSAATNVFTSMILPRYIKVQFGTLVVDGRTMTDFADEDLGQIDNGTVSVIWPRFAPGEQHTIAFELVFDREALKALKDTVSASANPLINLQMSVGFAESDVVFTSPVVTLEPDLGLLAPVAEPQPVIVEEPVVPPTNNDTNEISNVLDGLIQQEAQQNTVTKPSAPVPGAPVTNTNTSYDGGSFNIDVNRTDGNKLSVSGSATPMQNQIEFMGTTSLPNSLITLIFNDSVTVFVTSDANGDWRTFVSADQLGVKQGQTLQVKIEAIAAKGDLRSDKVQVGNVTVSLAQTNDVQAQFDTAVAQIPVLTAVNTVRKEVAKQIVKQEPVIQTTLASAAPVVIVSSVPLWGYLPYLPTLIYHFITYAVGLLGRRRQKRQRFYGVVYDSITKQPLALAIIRIYNKDTNRLVATQVSDKQGRYDVLLEPASYRLEVTKPSYSFPSSIVTADIDGQYQHVYHNELGLAVQSEEITVPDVPLDPVNAQRQWQISSVLGKLWLALQNVGNYLAVPVLMVGALASVVVLMTIPNNPINWLLAVLYVGMFAAQLRLRPHLQKAWGVVYDLASNAALPLTTIQLIDPQYGKVVTSRLTDYQGRYSFLPEPGHYVLKASKPGYEQIKEVIEAPKDKQHHPIAETVDITKPDERITGDVPMKPTI